MDFILKISSRGFDIWFCGTVAPSFFGVFGFYKGFEAGKVCAPELAVLIEPGIYRAQRFGIELVNAVTAFAVFLHQVGAAQETEVFRDRGP
jgi:hypothetical protein